MMDGEITDFINLAKAMTFQAQLIATTAQSMALKQTAKLHLV